MTFHLCEECLESNPGLGAFLEAAKSLWLQVDAARPDATVHDNTPGGLALRNFHVTGLLLERAPEVK